MLRAIIDIGSNSIKMRIAAVTNGHIRVIRDETEVVRLGRGMSESGVLSPESMKVSCEAVSRMTHRASLMGAEIFAVGTMALRTAKNSDVFVKMVKDSCGQEIHVLSGEEEAKYSWLGAVDGLGITGNAVMFDSGGGSTEFVMGSEGEIRRVVSVPVGAVNLSERFFCAHDTPIKKSACDEAISYVKNMLSENRIEDFTAGTEQQTVIAVGVIGLPASRADVILGSACIIFTALRILNARSCIVSINGLRHGLLLRDR